MIIYNNVKIAHIRYNGYYMYLLVFRKKLEIMSYSHYDVRSVIYLPITVYACLRVYIGTYARTVAAGACQFFEQTP